MHVTLKGNKLFQDCEKQDDEFVYPGKSHQQDFTFGHNMLSRNERIPLIDYVEWNFYKYLNLTKPCTLYVAQICKSGLLYKTLYELFLLLKMYLPQRNIKK